ncbi:CPBP family intramembrane glutamic endopeptidase [Caldisalinibacter kiritimatiensis]|uniref:CAAX amino terminal protease family protein n=1 Tax=Caldisalinibacter kiritimatiensis TaxID=1304284 RepID=R1CLN2_9FIRM|nr:CPBP family intramembrane glutamic endopeptidase [Caldisalinibacter kiritimatiensis]EOC99605.1 CAAX amino terminal protease family protein [Caldisalinibacter kiritimatiensis]
MGLISYILFFSSILLVLILMRQYFEMWIILDRLGLKLCKYFLPILEITLLLLLDDLFLLPSVIIFLLLIYDGKVLKDKAFRKFYTISKKNFMINKKTFWFIVFLSPVIFYLLNITSSIILDIINKLNFDITINEADLSSGNKKFIDYVSLFGVTCIIAPIVEEFTFRVLIYRNWLPKFFNKKVISLLISSLIFTISHFEIEMMPYTLLTGIILGITYDFFGYLGSVLLHSLLNFFTFVHIWAIINNSKVVIIIYIAIIFMFIKINILDKKRKYDAKI